MWTSFLDWFAERVSGASVGRCSSSGARISSRRRALGKYRIVVTGVALGIFAFFTLTLAARFGVVLGLVPPGLLAALSLLGARGVFVARDEVWRAACLPLEDPRQGPKGVHPETPTAPTERALLHLAVAVDAARRGHFADAHDEMTMIPRRLLRPEEARLLDGVRATVSLGLGEPERAAQQAIVALPTGSDDLDRTLGRALLRDAWQNDARVSAIDAAWAACGVTHEEGPLPRLRRVIRLRVRPEDLDASRTGRRPGARRRGRRHRRRSARRGSRGAQPTIARLSLIKGRARRRPTRDKAAVSTLLFCRLSSARARSRPRSPSRPCWRCPRHTSHC